MKANAANSTKSRVRVVWKQSAVLGSAALGLGRRGLGAGGLGDKGLVDCSGEE